MKRIAIIAALPGELKPLVSGWQRRGRNLWAGRIGGCEVTAIAGGMGAASATRAVERVFADGAPDALVSYGWAGALTCAVKPPTACAISEIVDASSGARFATGFAKGYRLITLDHVVHVDEKRGLAEKFQSVLVDMEAATVARMATERGVDLYCFKGVSDGYTDRLPDFGRFVDGEGQLRMRAFAGYAAVHPQYWFTLQRLGKNSSTAAKGLAGLAKEALAKLQ